MVRKAVRTLSAIENQFRKLEDREAELRRFYEPEESSPSGPKHRYSHLLEWGDDISTLMTVDDPLAAEMLRRSRSKGKRKGLRPSSAPAGQAGKSGNQESALHVVVEGALEAMQRPLSAAPDRASMGPSSLVHNFMRETYLGPADASEPKPSPVRSSGRPPRPMSASPAQRTASPRRSTPMAPSAAAAAAVAAMDGADAEDAEDVAHVQAVLGRLPSVRFKMAPPESTADLQPCLAVEEDTEPFGWSLTAAVPPLGLATVAEDDSLEAQLPASTSTPPPGLTGDARLMYFGHTHVHQPRTRSPERARPEASRPMSARPRASRPMSGVPSHASSRPTSATPAMLRQNSAGAGAGASGQPLMPYMHQLRRSQSLGSSSCGTHGTHWENTRAVSPRRHHPHTGPSNGFVNRNPAGPSISTCKAQRPMSAKLSGMGDRAASSSGTHRPASAMPKVDMGKSSGNRRQSAAQHPMNLSTANLQQYQQHLKERESEGGQDKRHGALSIIGEDSKAAALGSMSIANPPRSPGSSSGHQLFSASHAVLDALQESARLSAWRSTASNGPSFSRQTTMMSRDGGVDGGVDMDQFTDIYDTASVTDGALVGGAAMANQRRAILRRNALDKARHVAYGNINTLGSVNMAVASTTTIPDFDNLSGDFGDPEFTRSDSQATNTGRRVTYHDALPPGILKEASGHPGPPSASILRPRNSSPVPGIPRMSSTDAAGFGFHHCDTPGASSGSPQPTEASPSTSHMEPYYLTTIHGESTPSGNDFGEGSGARVGVGSRPVSAEPSAGAAPPGPPSVAGSMGSEDMCGSPRVGQGYGEDELRLGLDLERSFIEEPRTVDVGSKSVRWVERASSPTPGPSRGVIPHQPWSSSSGRGIGNAPPVPTAQGSGSMFTAAFQEAMGALSPSRSRMLGLSHGSSLGSGRSITAGAGVGPSTSPSSPGGVSTRGPRSPISPRSPSSPGASRCLSLSSGVQASPSRSARSIFGGGRSMSASGSPISPYVEFADAEPGGATSARVPDLVRVTVSTTGMGSVARVIRDRRDSAPGTSTGDGQGSSRLRRSGMDPDLAAEGVYSDDDQEVSDQEDGGDWDLDEAFSDNRKLHDKVAAAAFQRVRQAVGIPSSRVSGSAAATDATGAWAALGGASGRPTSARPVSARPPSGSVGASQPGGQAGSSPGLRGGFAPPSPQLALASQGQRLGGGQGISVEIPTEVQTPSVRSPGILQRSPSFTRAARQQQIRAHSPELLEGEDELLPPKEDEPEFYQLSACLDHAGDLTGWLFNVYLTDLGEAGSTVGIKHCIATAVPVDDDSCILCPVPNRDQKSSHPTVVASAGKPVRSATIAASELLPWVSYPYQLYKHFLRVEAFSVVPKAEKMLDVMIYMGHPDKKVPQEPDPSRMTITKFTGASNTGRKCSYSSSNPEPPSQSGTSHPLHLNLKGGLRPHSGTHRLSAAGAVATAPVVKPSYVLKSPRESGGVSSPSRSGGVRTSQAGGSSLRPQG